MGFGFEDLLVAIQSRTQVMVCYLFFLFF